MNGASTTGIYFTQQCHAVNESKDFTFSREFCFSFERPANNLQNLQNCLKYLLGAGAEVSCHFAWKIDSSECLKSSEGNMPGTKLDHKNVQGKVCLKAYHFHVGCVLGGITSSIAA